MNYKSSRTVHNQRPHLDNDGDNPWTTSLVGLYKSSRAVHNQRPHLDNKGDNPWTTSLVGLYTINAHT